MIFKISRTRNRKKLSRHFPARSCLPSSFNDLVSPSLAQKNLQKPYALSENAKVPRAVSSISEHRDVSARRRPPGHLFPDLQKIAFASKFSAKTIRVPLESKSAHGVVSGLMNFEKTRTRFQKIVLPDFTTRRHPPSRFTNLVNFAVTNNDLANTICVLLQRYSTHRVSLLRIFSKNHDKVPKDFAPGLCDP